MHHDRNVVGVDEQAVIRMNRDTLYSSAVFDLTTPVTITLPDAGDRFRSLLVINQDHYVKAVEYAAGDYTLTQDADRHALRPCLRAPFHRRERSR
jgi:hypothetical protein